MKTSITEMLNIEHPVIQGGMQRVSTAELVAAVANAGALGFLSALTQPTPALLAKEIERTRSMTDKPFGVNLTILPTLTPPPYEEYAQVIIDAGIKVVETAGRSPAPFMPMFNAAGIKVIHKCTSIRHAKKAQAVGCAAVTIDGFEAAGHPGEDDIPSLILVPRAVDELDIPVIACGGFSDGRGLAAALALGADAVSMGTRFLCTQEARVHQNLKDKLVGATELDTQLIFRKFKNTARVFKNSISMEVAAIESREGSEFDDVAPLVSGQRGGELLESGDMEHGIWWAGMSSGLVYDVPTIDELVTRIVSDAESIIKNRLMSIVG
ncbi:NAD(P)H-dependent flavin oxidoreductase [Cognaticolwellia beringensis]|uniref:Nitronate monooxygenase n=1 Tax=Cognaticolwellia beringensis TaxID=1967665 RepID=A0A222G3N9_9GAMM|nr:nitronate monooxygenase family protein [Cognaticolwellia beringensis]ASP46419.1 nitronate monooxygenase [Cognaticolwellia beringensis]|tara:strand:+ start:1094 stop:2065 length:972 start_codon:yes stop_codon:yes gene_type:complete